jgi:hypothetical protein
MLVRRQAGESAYCHRLAEEVEKLAPHVDAVLLTQFSMAAALAHLQGVASVPVLSAPHSSAQSFKILAPVSSGA